MDELVSLKASRDKEVSLAISAIDAKYASQIKAASLRASKQTARRRKQNLAHTTIHHLRQIQKHLMGVKEIPNSMSWGCVSEWQETEVPSLGKSKFCIRVYFNTSYKAQASRVVIDLFTQDAKATYWQYSYTLDDLPFLIQTSFHSSVGMIHTDSSGKLSCTELWDTYKREVSKIIQTEIARIEKDGMRVKWTISPTVPKMVIRQTQSQTP